MITVVTIIAFGLSVASLVVYFTSLWWVAVLCLVGTILISSIGFIIERKIKTHGGTVLNRLFYSFSRSDKKFNIESAELTYSCLDGKKYISTRSFRVKSKKKDLRNIEEKFCWSAPSFSAKIEALENGHSIKGVHKEEIWTHYLTDFGCVYPKNEIIKTGSKITNLVDPNDEAVPFLSFNTYKKTKLVVLTVLFPETKKPKGDAEFKIKVGAKEVGKPIRIPYDKSLGGFTKTIEYPRKGWTYLLSWEK